MKSVFRPAVPPDRAMLDDRRGLLRRGVLREGMTLGALTMLTGCDLGSAPAVENGLRQVSALNDWIQARLFDPTRLAPTYPKSLVLQPPKFNAYYDVAAVKPVDAAHWTLDVTGLVADRKRWSLPELAALPQADMVIRHVCVEGWDYIGEWSGPTLRTVLERCGADLRARYVNFFTADDYPSSIDMATALHPQTLLATGYAGAPLADLFGFPLRLRMSTKLGYKNPKWITAMEVTNDYMPGYWEKLGFNWFAGL
ncbi:MAG: molybdopterin-dependent oxidoreductase [Janthinobacterium lividum]